MLRLQVGARQVMGASTKKRYYQSIPLDEAMVVPRRSSYRTPMRSARPTARAAAITTSSDDPPSETYIRHLPVRRCRFVCGGERE